MSSKLWLYSGLALVGVGLARHLVSLGPRLVRGDTLLVIGDSLAVGLAPYLTALAREHGMHVTTLAKQGTRIDQWAQSPSLAQALAAQPKPKVVLVSLGTNDAYMHEPEKTQAPHLERLLALIKSSGAHVAWVGPPTLPTLTRAPSSALLELIRARVPSTSYFHSEMYPIERGPDRLHPSARGYAAWAGQIWCWLTAVKCARTE